MHPQIAETSLSIKVHLSVLDLFLFLFFFIASKTLKLVGFENNLGSPQCHSRVKTFKLITQISELIVQLRRFHLSLPVRIQWEEIQTKSRLNGWWLLALSDWAKTLFRENRWLLYSQLMHLICYDYVKGHFKCLIEVHSKLFHLSYSHRVVTIGTCR